MNLIKEFLEASNLHGLVYISKAESKWAKVLWTVSVVISFSIAGLLINESYTGWKTHPVSSVISTHPVRDLKFPNVTVCPPKVTNTALNYDLVNLEALFSAAEKDELTKEIKKTFFEKETQAYVKTLCDIVNEENMINVYKGFQDLPKHMGDTGYSVRLFGQKGEIFAKHSDKYNAINYILEFPENLEQHIGETGRLAVDIILDSDSGTLEYREGPKFWAPVWDGIGKSWQVAANYCKEMGGKLPTITTSQENRDLLATLNTNKALRFWLGGRNVDVTNNNWTWVDGMEWGFKDWYHSNDSNEAQPNARQNQCLYLYWGAGGTSDGTWYGQDCDKGYTGYKVMSYVCEFEVERITGKKKTLTYQKNDLPKDSLHFLWTSLNDKKNETETHESRTALSLKWRIENKFPNLELVSTKLNGNVETPNFGGKFEEEFYLADRANTLTLDLPRDIDNTLGDRKLVIHIKVDTEVIEVWREAVLYSDGPTFKFYPERKTWEEAAKTCVDAGTHLAPMLNWREREEMLAFNEKQLWIGGAFNDSDSGWSWVDGEAWEATWWVTEKMTFQKKNQQTQSSYSMNQVFRVIIVPEQNSPSLAKEKLE